MKNRKIKSMIYAAGAMALVALPFTAFADEKINSVNIHFECEEGMDDEFGMLEITAETDGNHYEASDVIPAADYFNDGSYEDNDKAYVIELTAEDDYYFNITKSSSIRLSGEGADLIKASRRDNGQTLIVTVELSKLETPIGDIESVSWNGQKGEWTEAFGADLYKLTIIGPDGKRTSIETAGTTYDFRPLMQKSGDYYFKVRAKNAAGKTSEWLDSSILNVTADMAAQNKSDYEVKKEITYKDGIVAPDMQIVKYLNTGWQKTNDGHYWYRNEDATYPQNNWLYDGDSWYFFDTNGYMVTNEYVTWKGSDYYFGNDGKLVAGVKTPDGRTSDTNGVLQ